MFKRFIMSMCVLYSCVFASKPELMLLEEWKGQDVSGWLMSEKMDGVRAYWDGKKLLSRNGNEFAAPSWFTDGFPPFPVDGELWSKRGEFDAIVSTVKKKEPHDGWKNIAFYAFDVPLENGGLIQRLVKLEYYLKLNQADYLQIAKQIPCENEEHLKSFLFEIEKGGGEDVVVRNPDSKYVAKRDPNSLKVKNFQDAECEVIEHHKGEGKYKNSFGSLTCRTSEGIAFDIGAGFTENERKNPPHIGAMITYKYQEITKGGKPRFPVYLRTKEEI